MVETAVSDNSEALGMLQISSRLSVVEDKVSVNVSQPNMTWAEHALHSAVAAAARAALNMTQPNLTWAVEQALGLSGRQVKAVLNITQPDPDLIWRAKNAQQVLGLTVNKAGDLEAFNAALITNALAIIGCIMFMMMGKHFYPMIYCNNVTAGFQPYQIRDVWFGWARAALGISVDEITNTVGLDQAMLIEYTQMNMKILGTFGVPVLLVLSPLNYFCGGDAAGEDRLSVFSFGNVVKGSWLHWVYAPVVWVVVITVQLHIYKTMEKFVERRVEWLEDMPRPRATTIMIQGIPSAYQTDDRLKGFFAALFGADKLKSAYIAKRAQGLKQAFHRKADAVATLDALKQKWEENGSNPSDRPKSFTGVDLLDYYESEIAEAEHEMKLEWDRSQAGIKDPGGLNGHCGFVTFHHASDAQIAAKMQYDTDSECWVTSVPPPPEAILWKDLEQNPYGKVVWQLVGCVLLMGLYMLYLPSVVWITTIAMRIKFQEPVQAFWAALAPTLGLQFMVCFLPTFLVLIFKFTMTLYDTAYAQRFLQDWYFAFQFVFVIMVTAIGDSLGQFMLHLVESPLQIMPLLAKTMPQATHFYMNFLVLGWSSHALCFTRYMNVFKFLMFKGIFDNEKAAKMSEPEDQDYYGLGSRNARFSIMMSIGIIFGTLCPPICVLAFLNFFMCRLVYGFLIPFAETRKPDLGGEFFVQACFHLFVANFVYVFLMAGVLANGASTYTPALVVLCAIPYVVWSMVRFKTQFNYETLPFAAHLKSDRTPRESRGVYIQPEWNEDNHK